MSMNSTSLKSTLRALRASVLVASLATFGLVGCSSGDGSSAGGGSTAKSSAGQSGSSGGQSSQGGSSSSSTPSGGKSGGGQSSIGSSSSGGSAGCTCYSSTFSPPRTGGTGGTGPIGGTGGTRSAAGTDGTGGSVGTGGKGGTGGTATGGNTGGSAQGGQDGGAGTSGSNSSSPDAGVDRTPDTSAPVPDGGSAGFCPNDGTACKIMAMGDSITDGVGSSGGGYRVPLFKLALTDSKNITFVGRNTNGPTSVTVNGQTKQFPRGHEGYSGWTIKDGGGRSGIYGKVDGAMQTNMPHIITLMIGTNDVDINLDLANAPNRLGELLDKIATDAPKALIVVAKLVPTKDDNENTRFRTYNEGIVAPVQTRVNQGKNIIMVDMYKAFTDNANYKTALMNDNLHPKDAGYEVMAKTWYDAIKSYLH